MILFSKKNKTNQNKNTNRFVRPHCFSFFTSCAASAAGSSAAASDSSSAAALLGRRPRGGNARSRSAGAQGTSGSLAVQHGFDLVGLMGVFRMTMFCFSSPRVLFFFFLGGLMAFHWFLMGSMGYWRVFNDWFLVWFVFKGF